MKPALTSTLAALALVLAMALPAVADSSRPFAVSWVSADQMDFTAPGCPTAAFFRFSTDGRGQAIHLGETAISVTHCTFVDMASATGGWHDGSVTLTAANGDRLELRDQGTFELVVNPDPGPPFASATTHTTWTVVGGTGRFAEATGSGTGLWLDNLVTGIQHYQLDGTISY